MPLQRPAEPATCVVCQSLLTRHHRMGEIRAHRSVLGILAAFSRHDEALAWARATAIAAWGPVALESPVFAFEETRFYEATMGPGLRKILLAFERLIDPAELVPRKHQTNAWEQQYPGKARTRNFGPSISIPAT